VSAVLSAFLAIDLFRTEKKLFVRIGVGIFSAPLALYSLAALYFGIKHVL
jgi:hypothetical protein